MKWYEVGIGNKYGETLSFFSSLNFSECFEKFNGKITAFMNSDHNKLFIDKWKTVNRSPMNIDVIILFDKTKINGG